MSTSVPLTVTGFESKIALAFLPSSQPYRIAHQILFRAPRSEPKDSFEDTYIQLALLMSLRAGCFDAARSCLNLNNQNRRECITQAQLK